MDLDLFAGLCEWVKAECYFSNRENNKHPISTHLVTVHMDSAPEYDAIPYVWGDTLVPYQFAAMTSRPTSHRSQLGLAEGETCRQFEGYVGGCSVHQFKRQSTA
ncbi:uncharacterized protein BCR38DRAFT_136507 [Pseudomassariella vexata]|uniref:Uncharacterized protein n=1 Tax=Pseudomassariella vexata TaxID=1141098 RepID=A0A1Y2EAT0_9PEZI|nr:uncharacterized protein BCR38DRAFT_136507 [Pseudomassariella vexata]ORY68678.1 hypothetical protein BCR38DRAFT_136507 [Pseudomassariella vexata]